MAPATTVKGNNAPVTINQTIGSQCANQAGDSISPDKKTSPTEIPGGMKMKKRPQGSRSAAKVARNVVAGAVMLGLSLDGVGVHPAQSSDF
ncbi:MAG: hypothetical protein RR517_19380 [Pseudomonas sp.]